MPNHFYRHHSRMRPNLTMTFEANRSYDLATEHGFSGYSADYLIELAVYDQLGGFPARVAAQQSHSMEVYHTSRYFDARSRGLTPSAIIKADLIEDEQFQHLSTGFRRSLTP